MAASHSRGEPARHLEQMEPAEVRALLESMENALAEKRAELDTLRAETERAEGDVKRHYARMDVCQSKQVFLQRVGPVAEKLSVASENLTNTTAKLAAAQAHKGALSERRRELEAVRAANAKLRAQIADTDGAAAAHDALRAERKNHAMWSLKQLREEIQAVEERKARVQATIDELRERCHAVPAEQRALAQALSPLTQAFLE